ncbi:hypothetical protein BFF94_006485 [Burkholderia catarinensis]|nr:hypothetical protein BFF94_006485 [Burkholderia catarinensis]
MVPERGAAATGASDAGSNGGGRSASFTIGGFWPGCEKIGGRIGRASVSRNGIAIAVVRCPGICHPSPSARRARRCVSAARDGRPAG